jgi:hypothetical protein
LSTTDATGAIITRARLNLLDALRFQVSRVAR